MDFSRRWAVLVLGTGLMAAPAVLAQRPILPICSDNEADKLPSCKAPAGQATPAPASVSPAGPAPAFPFPGDAPPVNAAPAAKSAADQFPFPGSEPVAPAAAQPTAQPQTPAAGQFPFPGEDVPAPVLDPNAKVYDPKTGEDVPVTPKVKKNPAAQDDPGSSSSSAGGAADAADDDASPLKDEGSEGTTKSDRRRLPKVEDMGKREEEDIKVARYYHSTGNYMGAYLRAKDALKIDPEDAEAHFLMALNAQRLAKKDEAIAGYTTYLKLAPDGDDAKTAERGLAALK